MRKRFFLLFTALALASIWFRTAAHGAEDWKGSPDPSDVTLAAMTGMGIIDTEVGFTLLGAAAKKIIPSGFIPDINNSVWLEGMVGPLFISGATAWLYSAHLRWDFVKDPEWTFYTLGGLGGNIRGESLGNHFVLHPRFAAGVLWNFYADFSIRGELSSEMIIAGAQFSF